MKEYVTDNKYITWRFWDQVKKVCGHNILKENRVTYYSWGFKYHITNKGKNKPFPKVGQGLLNGRLLQSAAMDCTVHCSRLYGPL